VTVSRRRLLASLVLALPAAVFAIATASAQDISPKVPHHKSHKTQHVSAHHHHTHKPAAPTQA
jgi:hypothetical protein